MCGRAEKFTQNWLADHGFPVCGGDADHDCDADMLLEPVEPNSAIPRLYDKAIDACLAPEYLDELVHELAASIAADVNNGGMEDQLAYLIDAMGVKETEKQIDKLIDDHKLDD